MYSFVTPALRDAVVAIAKQAGAAIMDVYNAAASSQLDVTVKSDNSPLTQADLRANAIIVAGLNALTPRWRILSEESSEIPYAERAKWKTYWLVDPLDGTKEFVSRNGEFTVNIALIHEHAPVLGVVHVPASSATYTGASGIGAHHQLSNGEFRAVTASTTAADPLRVVGSRSHRGALLDSYLAKLGAFELVSMGSSLKFCLVADGQADLYPRLGPTSEWDTAAAQAIVEAAGGVVCTLDGQRLLYNTKADVLNPSFLVYADASRDWLRAASTLS
jgi:3'(2'), 5'-bisphosphate nucleotidase